MRNHRMVRPALIILVLLALVALSLPGVAAQSSEDEPIIHVVRSGETLSAIAHRYGVPLDDLAEANGITRQGMIYTGQRLTIPPVEGDYTLHIVQKGETLLTIAAKYGVSARAIAERSSLRSWNWLFVGQRLLIPQADATRTPTPTAAPDQEETPTATPEATATAEATSTATAEEPDVREEIIISSPEPEEEVSSPLVITGYGIAFENTLAVDILDGDGQVIGQGYAIIGSGDFGWGPYTGTVEFDPPATAQLGRVQIYSISPRDGAIEHLASVSINLQPE